MATCRIDKGEISIYSGELSKECIAENLLKIKNAFPVLAQDFYTVFMDRIRENGFSNERLKDAIDFVIDNCVYPQPTIAQFVSFDKRIKTYTYQEYCNIASENRGVNILTAVKIEGNKKPIWVRVEDAEKYNLKSFEK